MEERKKKELLLKSGTDFYLTREIPELIINALYPASLDAGPSLLVKLSKKIKGSSEISGGRFEFPNDVSFLDTFSLSVRDKAILEQIWVTFPLLPIPEAEWNHLAQTFEEHGSELDWELVPAIETAESYYGGIRFFQEPEHCKVLRDAIETGELEQLHPKSQIPTNVFYEDGIVTTAALIKYVEKFNVIARIDNDSELNHVDSQITNTELTHDSHSNVPAASKLLDALENGMVNQESLEKAPKYKWIAPVREKALKFYDEAIDKGYGSDQESIAKRVAEECEKGKIHSEKGKPLTAKYIRRHALTPWDIPQIALANRQK